MKRPHIPMNVRVKVAARQLRQTSTIAASVLYGLDDPTLSDSRRLRILLGHLFGTEKFELHHRPALVNRHSYVRVVKGRAKLFYRPAANDQDFLVYLPKDDHGIETRVRGIGALRSDLGQRRYNKRVAENRGLRKRRPKAKIKSQTSWPKRSFQIKECSMTKPVGPITLQAQLRIGADYLDGHRLKNIAAKHKAGSIGRVLRIVEALGIPKRTKPFAKVLMTPKSRGRPFQPKYLQETHPDV